MSGKPEIVRLEFNACLSEEDVKTLLEAPWKVYKQLESAPSKLNKAKQ